MIDKNIVIVDLKSMGIDDQLSPKIVSSVQSSIQTSLALIKDRWVQEAQKKLHRTRADYLLGLQFGGIIYPLDDPFSGAVRLSGTLPNMIESGFKSFDMKIGFSKSTRLTRKKDGGWYLTIPFRHSTPNSYMYGQTMSKDIYGVAKKLNPYKSGLPNTRLKIAGIGDKSWTGYQRKSNQYNGLVRIVKSYQKATQSQYMTFRRVSNNSDAMSWWHRGYKGVRIADRLMPYAESTFLQILKHNLNKL